MTPFDPALAVVLIGSIIWGGLVIFAVAFRVWMLVNYRRILRDWIPSKE